MRRTSLGGLISASASAILCAVTLTGFSLPALADGGTQAQPLPQGQLTVLTPYVYPGDQVRWTATGLPASATLDLDWQSVSGHWVVDGANLGTSTEKPASYTFSSEQIGTVQASASGTASSSFTLPDGFGGMHNFQLTDADGTAVGVGSVIESIGASISRTSVPQGDLFHITVKGLAYGAEGAEYGVLYDNHYMGFISGVSTDGTATFSVRAEGVGTHQISLRAGAVEGPYLNEQEGPYAYLPRYYWTVQVTKGVPATVVDPEPQTDVPAGTNLTVTPTSGVVGSTFTLQGQGLPADTALTVVWNTMSGNRVTSSMYQTAQTDLATVTTDANGSFTWQGTVPDDLGGPPHEIDLMQGSQKVGSAEFRIMPQFVGVTPSPAKVGSMIVVHLTGVGWTQYDNIYAVDYDNAYMGYACGFNSHGDVHIHIPAIGAPGYHFIDIYPSPYQGSASLPNWYGMPQLTYAQDHPGDTLPAFHIVIEVTE